MKIFLRLGKFLTASALFFGVLVAFGDSKHVLQIFRQGELIQEYPIDEVYTVKVREADENEDLPGVIQPVEPDLSVMEAMIDLIYMNIWSTGNFESYVGDPQVSVFQRGLFNLEELPSDETFWMWDDSNGVYDLNFGFATGSSDVEVNTYSRMMHVVTLCNMFINTDFHLDNITDEADRHRYVNLHEEFLREAKILRCAMYFYLINEFGNVPYADEYLTYGELPRQLSSDFSEGRRYLTEQTVNTLEELVDWYKANEPSNKPVYGHVGLDVAEALLVKFYLNYEVFTGYPEWKKCFDHAQSVISRLATGGFRGSGLANDYFQCFSPSNRTDAANEIIWRIATLDKENNPIISYANGSFMMWAYIGDNFDGEYNTSQAGWKCMAARRQLVDVFEWDADYYDSLDRRTAWWKSAKHGFSIDNEVIQGPEWGYNGFLPIKYTNWAFNDDGSIDYQRSPDGEAWFNPIDYAIIRLAEIYLSAAEAAFHGAGSIDLALQYVNLIRQRAGMPALASLTLEDICNERQRELYTECNRRTDLIRYGKWLSGYNWNWKAGLKNGGDFPSRFIVYPLPLNEIILGGYTQNPGY